MLRASRSNPARSAAVNPSGRIRMLVAPFMRANPGPPMWVSRTGVVHAGAASTRAVAKRPAAEGSGRSDAVIVTLPALTLASSTPVSASTPIVTALLDDQTTFGPATPVSLANVCSPAAIGLNGDQLVMSPITPSVNWASNDRRMSLASRRAGSGAGGSQTLGRPSWAWTRTRAVKGAAPSFAVPSTRNERSRGPAGSGLAIVIWPVAAFIVTPWPAGALSNQPLNDTVVPGCGASARLVPRVSLVHRSWSSRGEVIPGSRCRSKAWVQGQNTSVRAMTTPGRSPGRSPGPAGGAGAS